MSDDRGSNKKNITHKYFADITDYQRTAHMEKQEWERKEKQLEQHIQELDIVLAHREQEIQALAQVNDHNHQRILQMDAELQTWHKIYNDRLKHIVHIMRQIKQRLMRVPKQNTDVEVIENQNEQVEQKTQQSSAEYTRLTPVINTVETIKEYPVTVSVVVPTYNAGTDLNQLLGMLSMQVGIQKIEVIIVDSGSTDNTVQTAKWYGTTVIEITQQQFSHSYARNLGAKKATGEYLLFMTQDAFPTDEYWVYQLLTPVIENKVVALSPMEQPRLTGDLKYKVDNWYHIQYLGVSNSDKIGRLPTEQDWDSMRQNAQLMDIACLISKDVFMQYQYQGDFAEDLDLGLRLIRDGKAIGLISSVKVSHSHARSSGYYMKRNLVDLRTIKKMLPDYPMANYTQITFVEKILSDYVSTIAYLDEIEKKHSKFDNLESYCNYLVQETQVAHDIMSRSDCWGDHTVLDFLATIGVDEYYKEHTGQSKMIPPEFAGYISSALVPYIQEMKDLSLDLLREEIVETVYKCFTSYLGVHLAEYENCHKEAEDDIIKVMQPLLAGV